MADPVGSIADITELLEIEVRCARHATGMGLARARCADSSHYGISGQLVAMAGWSAGATGGNRRVRGCDRRRRRKQRRRARAGHAPARWPAHAGGHAADPAEPEQPDRLSDDQLIHYHITEALRKDRLIDHATARCIASQLHGGQASALYALASTGAVIDDLRGELNSWRRDETPVEVEPWLEALDEYLSSRKDDSPIDGWHQLWPAPPERGDDESDRGEEERPPYGALASAIGGAAVNVQAGGQGKGEQSVKQREEAEQPPESPALQRIRTGLEAANQDGQSIDDRTARDMARVFKAKPDGPLAVFAGYGAILKSLHLKDNLENGSLVSTAL